MSARLWNAVPWVIDGVLVYVDDVRAHHARARAEGAVISSEPEVDTDVAESDAIAPDMPRWAPWPTPVLE